MKMIHPEIEAAGEVASVDAYRQIYAPRGWQLMDPATEYANTQLGRFVRSPDDLTTDEARALIAQNGGDYPNADAKGPEVLETYTGMFGARAPRPSPATESPTGVPIKLYDPAEHTVDEVRAELAKADENERQRIYDAEAAGKNRVTILQWTPDTETAPADNQDQE